MLNFFFEKMLEMVCEEPISVIFCGKAFQTRISFERISSFQVGMNFELPVSCDRETLENISFPLSRSLSLEDNFN